jgi:hypothetical protein
MTKYRKKPIVIDAMQWTGDNQDEVLKFIGGDHWWDQDGPILVMSGGVGEVRAEIGDWIIRGVNGEFYPCKPDIFAWTYDLVEEDQ